VVELVKVCFVEMQAHISMDMIMHATLDCFVDLIPPGGEGVWSSSSSFFLCFRNNPHQ
jgi:hypothetical protein